MVPFALGTIVVLAAVHPVSSIGSWRSHRSERHQRDQCHDSRARECARRPRRLVLRHSDLACRVERVRRLVRRRRLERIGISGDGVSFPIPLAAALYSGHVVFAGTGTTSSCPGFGQAAPGFLCVYAHLVEGETVSIFHNGGLVGAKTYGFFLGGTASSNPALAYGSWTVTAPAGALTHSQTGQGANQSQFGEPR